VFLLFEDWEPTKKTSIFTDDFERSMTTLDDFEDGNINGWTTGGNANWYATTAVKHGGSYSAVSGDIGDNQKSYIQMSITGPATISFWWKVESELYMSSCADYLQFQYDGNPVWTICDKPNWAQKTYSIDSGTHTIKFVYAKDSSYTPPGYADAGWIDDLMITYASLEPAWTVGGSRNWFSTNLDPAASGGWSARSGAITDSQSSYISKSISGPAIVYAKWRADSEITCAGKDCDVPYCYNDYCLCADRISAYLDSLRLTWICNRPAGLEVGIIQGL